MGRLAVEDGHRDEARAPPTLEGPLGEPRALSGACLPRSGSRGRYSRSAPSSRRGSRRCRRRAGRADRQGPHVVEAVDVVGVGVGEEQGVEARDARAQGLEAEFGPGVDDDLWRPFGFDRGSRPCIAYRGGRSRSRRDSGNRSPARRRLVPEPRKVLAWTESIAPKPLREHLAVGRYCCGKGGGDVVALGLDAHEVDVVLGHARHHRLDARLGVALEGRDLELARPPRSRARGRPRDSAARGRRWPRPTCARSSRGRWSPARGSART